MSQIPLLPQGVAGDAGNALVVAVNDRLRRISSLIGTMTVTMAAAGQPGPPGPPGPAGVAQAGSLGIVIDGGGSTPATGSKGYIQVPYNCTINSWTMAADQPGSAQITVKVATYASFPVTASIVASAPPALVSAQKATNSALTGWITGLNQGNILEFNLDSASTLKRVVLQLLVTRT